MERWEQKVVCSNVYHCGPLSNCKRGEVLRVCCPREPPFSLHSLLQRFVFSSPGNGAERVERKKGMIVLLGATGPLWAQPVLSLDLWPVLLRGFSFGEGRQLGELREGWWTAGPILGERETEMRVRAWERERDARGKGEGKLACGGKRRRRKRMGGQERWPRSSLLLCVSLGVGLTHCFTHTHRHLACEKVLAELAGGHPLCVFTVLLPQKQWGAGNVDYPPESKYMSGWIWKWIHVNYRWLQDYKTQGCRNVSGGLGIMAER